MLVDREKLLSVLQTVTPGLTLKETVPQSACFVFSAGRVHTFNNQIYCSSPSPFGSDVIGALTAKPFLDLLSRLTDDELECEIHRTKKETGTSAEFRLYGGDKRSGIRIETDVQLPISSIEPPGDWNPLDSGFGDAVAVVSECAAASDNDWRLTCVHISPNYVEACDRYQAVRFPIKTPIESSVLLRASAVSKLTAMGATEFSVTPNWMHFRNTDGLVFACRKFPDEFLEISQHFSTDGGKIITLPGGLDGAVAKAEVFSAENSGGNMLQVVLREGSLYVKGMGAHGWYQERKQVQYDGPRLDFRISPKTLVSVMKRSNECHFLDTKIIINTGKYLYLTVTQSAE